jgi:Yip1 domain
VNVARRAYAIVADPRAEWAKIADEPRDAASLLTGYVGLLALIPAVFGFVGACVVGVVVPGGRIVRAPLADGWFGAAFGYVMTCAAVLLLGLLISLVAPLFDGRRDFNSGFKLAAYAYTPVWLAGIFLLAPGLRFLGLLGFYGVYILWTGLPRLMDTPTSRAPSYVSVVVACACALIGGIAVAQHLLFGLGL